MGHSQKSQNGKLRRDAQTTSEEREQKCKGYGTTYSHNTLVC